ncbi:DUF1826 domain-containing protein [Pseudomonas sp. HK3]
MNLAAPLCESPSTKSTIQPMSFPQAQAGEYPDILADIYRKDSNIVIWQRTLSDKLALAVNDILDKNASLQTQLVVSPQYARAKINKALGNTESCDILSEDIAELVDMFCSLFDLKFAGLRLTALSHAMCPRFHVDKIPCRLITTYQGVGSQWLPNNRIDRTKLGAGNQGKPDELSGLFSKMSDIQQLKQGDVALLKGELWEGNEGAGLVHRSPQLSNDARRLLLTLDFFYS